MYCATWRPQGTIDPRSDWSGCTENRTHSAQTMGTRPTRPTIQKARLSVSISASSQQVVHGRLGPQLLLHADGVAFLEDGGDLAFRIVEVTEDDRVSGAGLGAGGPAPGLTVVLALLVLEVQAEGALAGIADGGLAGHAGAVLLVLGGDQLTRGLAQFVVVAEVRIACAVGTGHEAVPASDAAVVVDDHDAVGRTLVGRIHRADRDARPMLAMEARLGHEDGTVVPRARQLLPGHDRVEDARRRLVLDLAGDDARLAADALLRVDDHAPFVLARWLRGRVHRPLQGEGRCHGARGRVHQEGPSTDDGGCHGPSRCCRRQR